MTPTERALQAHARRKIGLTYREIGLEFGVSATRAGQLAAKGQRIASRREAMEARRRKLTIDAVSRLKDRIWDHNQSLPIEVPRVVARRARRLEVAAAERASAERRLSATRAMRERVSPLRHLVRALAAEHEAQTIKREVWEQNKHSIRCGVLGGGNPYAAALSRFVAPVAHRSASYVAAWLTHRRKRVLV